uniref:bifunctional folylpolyglutamate synthase/dihydrofolate synthase n=1 Tax=Acetatifactor sp. TaxID=1872090 RepID=UPI00405664C4
MNLKKQNITTFEEAVDYLYKVPRFTTKNSLEDTKAYLSKLGNPDSNMKIIHVAGTNGKGSVCAYLRYILEEAGYTTAVFTSPHLVDIRERFLVRGQMVEKEAFLEAFLSIYEGLDWAALEQECAYSSESKSNKAEKKAYHPTFFEYLFFMAMLLFKDAGVDYVILETGLGGRLDATNSVGRKELSVITRIGLDHVEYLGETEELIAGEKAGIMQSGAPVVFADVSERVSTVFREKALELGIPAYSVSRNDYAFLGFENKMIDFSVGTLYYGYVRLALRTFARYQMENAALAVRAVEVLDRGRTITVENIIRGVNKCFWQGRMEEILPNVYVDGAHNEDGIRAFLETVKEDDCTGQRLLLFGVVQDKDFHQMVEKLLDSSLFERMAIAHLQSSRSASLESLKEILEHKRKEQAVCAYTLHDSVDTALRELLDSQMPNDRIYIVGSLYLVGEIKESLDHD